MFEDVINYLPFDLILLIFSALLISLAGNEKPTLRIDDFLKKNSGAFIIVLFILLSLVAYQIFDVLNNTPTVSCNSWEEACIPFIIYNLHAFVMIIFQVSILIFIVLFFLNWLSIHIDQKLQILIKNHELLYSIINRAIKLFIGGLAAFAILYAMGGLSWFFLEPPRPFQPVLFVYHTIDSDNVDFYFQNNSLEDKIITGIQVSCSFDYNSQLNKSYSWTAVDCDLPKVISSGKIEKISCVHKNYLYCITLQTEHGPSRVEFIAITRYFWPGSTENLFSTYDYPTIFTKK